jgi:hypothetical protein
MSRLTSHQQGEPNQSYNQQKANIFAISLVRAFGFKPEKNKENGKKRKNIS